MERMSSRNQASCIPKIGDLQSNYDWVECESKSRPGEVYYFNLRTMCRTWLRPLSRSIHIPHFSLKKVHSSASSDDDQAPLAVTDQETDINNARTQRRPVNLRKNASEKTRKVLGNASRLNSNGNSSSTSTSFTCSTCSTCSSESDENCRANARPNRSKPALQLKRAVEVGKVKRLAKQRKPNFKPTKIICEMYGTRTINYNFPNDIIIESKGSLSSGQDNSEPTGNVSVDFNDILLKIKSPNLSESSSAS